MQTRNLHNVPQESKKEEVIKNCADNAVIKEVVAVEEKKNVQKETTKSYDAERMSKENLKEILEEYALADKMGNQKE